MSAKRDVARKLVWFHAPSVGEGLQARAIIELLQRTHPEWQIAYSYFSPSAEKFARALPVDIAEYLPFDSAQDMRTLIELLQPAALFFVKLDVWPHLVSEAKRAGVRTGLLSATVAPRSGRLGVLPQLVLRDAYHSLDVVGAIDAQDAERLQRMGVRPGVLHVTGDTRFDQVRARADNVNRKSDVLRALHSTRPTVVAGSTWPSDEAVLFRAWEIVKQCVPSARLIIAPHEPTKQHIASYFPFAHRNNLTLARLSQLMGSESNRAPRLGSESNPGGRLGSESLTKSLRPADAGGNADVVVIDSVGVLGDVYALATIAYVGGGFHSAGLHSVIEPAAYGVPVMFGPGFDMSREAGLLVGCGGAVSVPDAARMAEVLVEWLGDDAARLAAGGKALGLVEAERGAAERSAVLVVRVS